MKTLMSFATASCQVETIFSLRKMILEIIFLFKIKKEYERKQKIKKQHIITI